MVDADRDPGAVVGEVVHAVGDGFAFCQLGEVVGGDFYWFAGGLPFLSGLGELPDELFFLGVDADHGVAAGQELCGEAVDVPELGVAIGVLGAFEGLAGGLQAEPDRGQDLGDHGVADRVSHRGQLVGEVTSRFRGPPQRRLRISPRARLDQRIQAAQQLGVGVLGFLTATTGCADTPIRILRGIGEQFFHPAVNR